MKILVLGGDGYLGWPTALHCRSAAMRLPWLDNFVRSTTTTSWASKAWFRSSPLQTRIAVWKELTGKTIGCYIGDLTDAIFTYHIISDFRPTRWSTSPSSAPRRTR